MLFFERLIVNSFVYTGISILNESIQFHSGVLEWVVMAYFIVSYFNIISSLALNLMALTLTPIRSIRFHALKSVKYCRR